jgi:hypothetical protein
MGELPDYEPTKTLPFAQMQVNLKDLVPTIKKLSKLVIWQ